MLLRKTCAATLSRQKPTAGRLLRSSHPDCSQNQPRDSHDGLAGAGERRVLQIGGPGTGGKVPTTETPEDDQTKEVSSLGNAGRNHKCTPSSGGIWADDIWTRMSCFENVFRLTKRLISNTIFLINRTVKVKALKA